MLCETPRLATAAVLGALARQLEHDLANQKTDARRPDCGGVFAEYTGADEPAATAPLVAACALLYIAGQERNLPIPIASATLLQHANLGLDYLFRFRRDTGLIDLRNVNYDSSPDTGFAVQALAPVVRLGRALAQRDPAMASMLSRLEQFIRPAAAGMLAGGFHTPNHRWVIASALAQAAALCPDLAVKPVIDAYLAEGFDVDEEGAYIERSVGVYDAVCDRSLLLLAEHWPCPQAVAAAQRNLELDLHLLHADGTAETGLSRRQDYGTRTVPLTLASAYLLAHHASPNPAFVAAAGFLWRQACTLEGRRFTPRLGELLGLAHVLMTHGDPPLTDAAVPDNFARLYPHNGFWRVRRGPLSATFFGGVTRLLTFTYGQAELASLKISQTYFGDGRFVAETLQPANDGIALRSSGLQRPHRPGYELPLGRPVPPNDWEAKRMEREWKRIPPAASELAVSEIEGGFRLRYRTLDGLDRVLAQIALDFAPGGIWETGDTRLRPQAGQVIFLTGGAGSMIYGADAIRIAPGAGEHSAWAMRDSEQAPGHVRILLTFVTPVDHTFTITGARVRSQT